MELKFSLETDDIYERETSFEHLLSDALKEGIIRDAKTRIASEKFKEFSDLVSDTIVAETKLRMTNFLSEEIVLTERYGEKTFVGSIEDLIKLRFDEVLLRPVDRDGKTLQGCTSSGQTWIEWSIERQMKKTTEDFIKTPSAKVEKTIQAIVVDYVDKKIVEVKDNAIKDQVDKAFVALVKK